MVDQEKRKRIPALSKFTRNFNKLINLLDNNASQELAKPQFESVQSSWEALENAHDVYLENTEDDINAAGGLDYLDGPGEKHSTALVRYSAWLKDQVASERESSERKVEADMLLDVERRKREARLLKEVEDEREYEELTRKFDSVLAEVDSGVDLFNRMIMDLEDSLRDASGEDKRSEWLKVESEFNLLKNKFIKLTSIDSTKDVTAASTKFMNNAETVFLEKQRWILPLLKDTSPVTVTSGGDFHSSSSSTKKEPVRLPRFQGEEKASPYLKFPVWKTQWDVLIEEYDEKWRSKLLWDYLDDVARSMFVGYETNYEEAINRLNLYFGNPMKVVSAVMREVMAPSAMVEGDYKGLLAYSTILENNYNRLRGIGLEHEISNTTTMVSILKKFPRSVAERWNDALSQKPADVKMKPFPVLVEWVKSRKETWERMIATDTGKKDSKGGAAGKGGGSFFGDTEKKNRGCFSCGEEGHIRRNCPKKRESQEKPKSRKNPNVKKFWCAFHKSNPDKRCFSDTCPDLKRLEASQRVKLLNENGDCFHCVGDHKSVDCQKRDRVCGGSKEDRGCSKSHNVHELFCVQAKVFSGSTVQSMGVDDDASGVVLSIMQVRGPRKGVVANVFWDLGCTSNFVRDDFAKICGFKGRKEDLSVTTLGGTVSDMTVTTYKCSLRDADGKLEFFEAYGMETITGQLSKINPLYIKKLFPNLSSQSIQMLQRGDHVDVLIGISHPSWHPERAEKAKGGGDFWIYRGKFGTCLGGRYPGIKEGTRKSNNLFFVNQSYHIECTSHPSTSHELEFCINRVDLYHNRTVVPDSSLGMGVVVDSRKEVSSDHLIDYVVHCNVVPDSSSGMGVVVDSRKEVSSDHLVDDVVHCNVVPDSSSVGVVVDIRKEVSSVQSLFENIVVSTVVPDQSVVNSESIHVSEIKDVSERFAVKEDMGAACFGMKTSILYNENLFFDSQSLGTVVEPRCGGCKCSKCPIPGAKFSFKEQQEFDVINNNLYRIEGENRWYTEYPWHCPRKVLPKNDKAALQNLISLERSLSKNPELAEDFDRQIKEMVERGAAVCLSNEEVDAWDGDYYYMPMVGVKGKKKWLRVCFDAARRQAGYPSLNDCLLKGPDRFVNNLLSVIHGFRNGRVGAVADIAKFHNQVYLPEVEMHMQRFLWRCMDKDVSPETYAVKVNNFGVKPANCIATCALHRSADHFTEIYPVESREMKEQTYIDDQLVADADKESILQKTTRLDEIAEHAGMPNKGWVLSGDTASDVSIGGESNGTEEKVLGLSWIPSTDEFTFHVVLKFSDGSNEVIVKSEVDFQRVVGSIKFTRRVLLANVARIFDPVGFLTPIILQTKILMRESWCGKITGWDDVLPEDLTKRWIEFLMSLLQLNDIKFPRSLWPEEDVVGLPSLVVFSDGSALAFGAVAYIRWELSRGGYWTRLIMAKGKIAPKGVVSIPRMELNGAVVGNRIRNFLLKETSMEFSKVYQFVDSSTVLGYVQKESGHFKPYEGVRVAEIQSSNKLGEGKLLGWAWVSTEDNPADWCTKPRSVKDLVVGGFWESGPDFLRTEESSWPIKHSYKKDGLEGEVKIPRGVYVVQTDVLSNIINRLLKRYSSWKKIVRVFARIMRFCKRTPSEHTELDAGEVKVAKMELVKFSQKGMIKELQEASEKGKGRYRKLAPLVDEEGLWRVGSRLKHFVPFTFDGKMPLLLPPDHRVTSLIMLEAHQFSHSGQDGTLSRFRAMGYWTIRGGHLAKSVKNSCVPCRKSDLKKLTQPMGDFPAEILRDPVAWGCCQLDLFGPFHCRGDVNPRTTKKTWGIVIEDVNSGAVHLDIVQDYSEEAVLLSMRRFGSLRGWPGILYSDPGSQLVSASTKLVSWWSELEGPLRRFATTKNFEWKVSPPDSPWRQGKAERRIAIVKRLIQLTVGDTRVTPVELQTIFFEIANICNERPLGLSKPRDDGSYDVITPNHLLLGRSSNILPDDASLVTQLPVASRYRLIQHVTLMFWNKWSCHVSPGLVIRQKWHEKSRNLEKGDLVMLCEHSAIKSKYKLGIVDTVHMSGDGFVRSVTIRYVNVKKSTNGDNMVSTTVYVKRSIQRLVLILPVEEQLVPVEVEDHKFFIMCRSIVKAGV